MQLSQFHYKRIIYYCQGRKCILISYHELMKLAGYRNYKEFQKAHNEWIEAQVGSTDSVRQPHGTESIAVGSKAFIKNFKSGLAIKNRGRRMRELDHGFELREPHVLYNSLFGANK